MLLTEYSLDNEAVSLSSASVIAVTLFQLACAMILTLSPSRPLSCYVETVSSGIANSRLKLFSNSKLCSRQQSSSRIAAISAPAQCSTSSLKQVKLPQARELQEKFGSQNLQFSDVDAMTVAELKLKSGTSARLLLADARITSYNCLLWHGSLEEFLFTDVLDSSTRSQDANARGNSPRQFTIIGGMVPSLMHALDPQVSLFNSNWSVESIEVNPEDHIQVTLQCCNGNPGDWGYTLYNIVTLTNRGLASALTVTNEDKKPLTFTASVSMHLGIRATEALSCVGVGGCKYFSPSEAALRATQGNPAKSLFQKLKDFVLPFQPESDRLIDKMQHLNEGDLNEEELSWFTERRNQFVSVNNGIHKIYADPPATIRITDEGLRRSLLFENHGFENLEVSSPSADGDKPFVSVGYGTVLSSITLNKGESWRGAQVLFPDVDQ